MSVYSKEWNELTLAELWQAAKQEVERADPAIAAWLDEYGV